MSAYYGNSIPYFLPIPWWKFWEKLYRCTACGVLCKGKVHTYPDCNRRYVPREPF
jgi:hypothetical protein